MSDMDNGFVKKTFNYELKLTNGKKIIVNIPRFGDVKCCEERTRLKLAFKKTFPFFEIQKSPYVKIQILGSSTILNVDCDIAAFMSLMGEEYNSFSEAVMRSAISGE